MITRLKKFTDEDYRSALNDIVKTLIGDDWDDAKDDESGSDWGDRWVSSRTICVALKAAYDAGFQDGMYYGADS